MLRECITTDLDEKNITDNKRVRRIVNLSRKWRNLKDRYGDSQGFNTFFSNVVQNPNISILPDSNPLI